MKSWHLLALALTPVVATASVHPNHARNSLKGEYRLDVRSGNTTETIEFVLSPDMKVAVRKASSHLGEVKGVAFLAYTNHNEGPSSLPVAHVLLSYGSDEDTAEVHVRISLYQDNRKTQPVFVDAIGTFSDGPNESASLGRLKSILSKKSGSGYVKLPQL